jgi:hypothetical protein
MIIRGWYNTQFVADVPSGLKSHPTPETKKKAPTINDCTRRRGTATLVFHGSGPGSIQGQVMWHF